jgi:hypothetical protein
MDLHLENNTTTRVFWANAIFAWNDNSVLTVVREVA